MSQAPTTGGQRDRSVLEEEREFFLRSLRDLEAERAAGDIDEVDYRALVDDYTVRAAQVLRKLAELGGSSETAAATVDDAALVDEAVRAEETLGSPSPAAASSLGSVPAVSPTSSDGSVTRRATPAWRRRALVGVAVALIVGGIAWAALGVAGVNPFSSGPTKAQRASQDVVNAEAAEGDGNPTEALKDYQAALRLEPGNVESLTGEGAILVTVGASGGGKNLVTQGIVDLGKAELADPNYGIAYAYRGLGYYDLGEYAVAVQQFKTYEADTPPKSREASIVTYLHKAEAKLKTAQ